MTACYLLLAWTWTTGSSVESVQQKKKNPHFLEMLSCSLVDYCALLSHLQHSRDKNR